MKKIFGLIAALALMTGCDDGDMSFKTFDFSTITATPCTGENIDGYLYYKVNGNEVLILSIPEGLLINTSTLDPVTGQHVPRTINITPTSATKITYREYNKTGVSVCQPKLEDLVVEEWNGTGTISVVTTPRINSSEKITGYSHTITLQNITFKKGDESVTINNNLFGAVLIDYGFTFDFIPTGSESPNVQSCNDNAGLLVTLKGNNGLELILANPSSAFKNEIGTVSIPVDEANNRILFTVYDNPVTLLRICEPGGSTLPNPVQGKRWIATAGTIEVKTTQTAGIYSHAVHLKGITFSNRDIIGEAFLLNDVATVTTEGYFFGNYTP